MFVFKEYLINLLVDGVVCFQAIEVADFTRNHKGISWFSCIQTMHIDVIYLIRDHKLVELQNSLLLDSFKIILALFRYELVKINQFLIVIKSTTEFNI